MTDEGDPMDVVDDLVDLIGNTPMMRLDRTARDVDCHLLAKLGVANRREAAALAARHGLL